jgi:hypothetical protein
MLNLLFSCHHPIAPEPDDDTEAAQEENSNDGDDVSNNDEIRSQINGVQNPLDQKVSLILGMLRNPRLNQSLRAIHLELDFF